MPAEPARERLAARQAELVARLLDGVGPAEGFDPEALRVTEQILAEKRSRCGPRAPWWRRWLSFLAVSPGP